MFIDSDKLADFSARLVEAGWRVVAPLREGEVVRLADWRPGATIDLRTHPVNAVKDAVMPPSETVARYRLEGPDFTPEPLTPPAPRTLVLGVRPCDLAMLATLDAVMNDAEPDPFYAARRAHLALAVIVCTSADEACFCTSVGGAPDAVAGADLVLRWADAGRRLALEPATPLGEGLLAAAGALAGQADAPLDPPAELPTRFDVSAVTDWCADNFDDDHWQRWTLACLGCGACAYACGACHCFDLQDESTRSRAERHRNWDACGLGLFTLHASGHNPRPDQAARFRQRVLHKFLYLPERVGQLGCSGCGRCERICPAGMSMREVAAAIAHLASRRKAHS